MHSRERDAAERARLARSEVESKATLVNAPRGRVLRVTTLAALAFGAIAASPSGSAASGDVTISVLTMGPGDPALSKFGHDAIVVAQSTLPQACFGHHRHRAPTERSDVCSVVCDV